MAKLTVKAPTRGRLSRDRVVRAAVALADNGGLEAITMRKLGQALGVEAMSLYNHVAGKEDLLDGLVDIVFSEIELDCDGNDWKTAMRRRATSAREVLGRHRWAIGLMESRRNPGPATLQHHDAVLRCLREAGFSIALAAHAYSALDSYIYGFALQQSTVAVGTGERGVEMVEAFLRQFPADRYPRLAEMATKHVMKPGYDYAEEFEFGLGLLLDGLERAKAPTSKGVATPSRRRPGRRPS
jgi:AcrR family transcriptional regulator